MSPTVPSTWSDAHGLTLSGRTTRPRRNPAGASRWCGCFAADSEGHLEAVVFLAGAFLAVTFLAGASWPEPSW